MVKSRNGVKGQEKREMEIDSRCSMESMAKVYYYFSAKCILHVPLLQPNQNYNLKKKVRWYKFNVIFANLVWCTYV